MSGIHKYYLFFFIYIVVFKLINKCTTIQIYAQQVIMILWCNIKITRCRSAPNGYTYSWFLREVKCTGGLCVVFFLTFTSGCRGETRWLMHGMVWELNSLWSFLYEILVTRFTYFVWRSKCRIFLLTYRGD